MDDTNYKYQCWYQVCIASSELNSNLFLDTVKDGRYPQISSMWETKTENLFYIGAAMGAIDRQSASGFVHGFRYNIRTLHSLLENRFFNKPLPSFKLPKKELQAVATTILGKIFFNISGSKLIKV